MGNHREGSLETRQKKWIEGGLNTCTIGCGIEILSRRVDVSYSGQLILLGQSAYALRFFMFY
jgi:hypothetical protein